MKETYTITRWENGWSVDVRTRDDLKDYSGVSEDPYWIEDERLSQAQSLAELLFLTFNKYIASDEEYGLTIEVDDLEEPETEVIEEGEENDSTG